MNGHLHLAFESAPTGATILHLRRQEPPWRIVRGFQGASGETLVHLHNVSGGVLSGDQLDLHAALLPGSRAQITTTGATRLYRRRAGAPEARSTARFEVGDQSLLELLPDPLIPYAGSYFAQETTIDLAPGATLFWWETLAPGREASGEVFQFERLRTTAQIRSRGVPIAIDRVLLDPQRRPMGSAARLADCRYLGTLYVCRVGEPADTWRRLEQCLHSQACRFMETEDGVRWGVSSLIRDGVVVRGMGLRGAAVIGALHEFWQAARLLLTGEPASLPRKVY